MLLDVTVRLSIGDFSRMTYLSVKTLRHYHEVGVLEPAEIDPASGYRFYRSNQVGLAHIIRRLRDLGMPLEEVRIIVQAPDAARRDEVLVRHLRRMETQLARTEMTVASLRALLHEPPNEILIERIEIASMQAVMATERVSASEVPAWWMEAFTSLHGIVDKAGVARAGADGALFPASFFQEEAGEVTVFVPVTPDFVDAPLPVQTRLGVVPGVTAAVAVHAGPFGDLDRTYGALGTWVLERAAGADGPIREYYIPTGDPDDLLAHITRVCWPVRA